MDWMNTTRFGKWTKQSKPKYSSGIVAGIVKGILPAVLFVLADRVRSTSP